MGPFVHGGIYGEVEKSTLGSRELRILIDSRAVSGETFNELREIDVLRHYLRDVPRQPCAVSLFATPPASDNEIAPQLLRLFDVQVLPSSDVSSSTVREALGFGADEHPQLVSLASAATTADADFLLTLDPAAAPRTDAFVKTLHMAAGGWSDAKYACELFTRGHEIPWSFSHPAWGWSWAVFYPMVEPPKRLVDFWGRVLKAGRFDADTQEHLRSLSLNRHAMICYTRDKLLFYVIQRRAAARHDLERQEFLFEVAYYLNHYYLLLWGGLDQLALALNGLFGLGVPARQVGFQYEKFQKPLTGRAPSVAALFNDPDFKSWVDRLAAARHFVAHRGVAAPHIVLLRDHDVTTEELDRKIEQKPEWQRLRDMIGPELMEQFRDTWRYRMLREEYEPFHEPAFKLEMDGGEVLIFPLVDIQWHFDHFFGFADKVAAETQSILGL